MATPHFSPLVFEPYLKTVIWGGNGIAKYKGIATRLRNIGESWELSGMPGKESVVARGAFRGRTLTDLLKDSPQEILGTAVYERFGATFPLLVKIIDAHDKLSVQVHPDEAIARRRHDSMGKAEMWYVVSATPEAKIYAGLSADITPEDYERRVADNTMMDVVVEHCSRVGDVYFLPPGCIHAIGAGNLLVEIQQASDITYRIYDYDRRDAYGNPRELHTDLAKDAIDYRAGDCKQDVSGEGILVRCPYFTVSHLSLDNASRELTFDSFMVVMCVRGTVVISSDGIDVSLTQGTTALIPAILGKATLSGTASVLLATVEV
ncbi:MAG: type I phosphomannose isomerase catalytic subunit [Muribaculaceae bacterium]